ncbi:MAG TPA: hypothetical protein VLC94_03990, partial [Candidatus Acidoferrum sp.]|nr:hypothetical protein [Candidatus Acidoferrum sp.]
QYYRDALFIGVGGTAALIALSRGTEWLLSYWHTSNRAFPASFGRDFDALLPGAAIPVQAIVHALMYVAMISALCSLILAHVKSPALRIVLFFAGSMAMAGGWGNPTDFMKQWLAQAIFLGVVFIGVTRVARMNLLGYFLVLAIPSLLLGAVELLGQPNAFYHQQGYLVVTALGALLLWPLAAWLGAADKQPQQRTAQQAS